MALLFCYSLLGYVNSKKRFHFDSSIDAYSVL
jgi:hypothetical protein